MGKYRSRMGHLYPVQGSRSALVSLSSVSSVGQGSVPDNYPKRWKDVAEGRAACGQLDLGALS